jgi:hypothetical protein
MRNARVISLIFGSGLIVAAACTNSRPVPAQPVTAEPALGAAVIGVGTPAPSPDLGTASTGIPLVSPPTFPPVMQSATRIPQAAATPEATLYVIENHGRPHFIEFHAWW